MPQPILTGISELKQVTFTNQFVEPTILRLELTPLIGDLALTIYWKDSGTRMSTHDQ